MADVATNVRYICGKTFDSHEGHHEVGDLAPESAAEWFNLDPMIHAGYLYPFVPDEGYPYLPPHVFSAVHTREEAQALIDAGNADQPAVEWDASPELELAQQEKQDELESIVENNMVAHEKAVAFYDKKATEGAVDYQQAEPKTDGKKAEAQLAGGDVDTGRYEGMTKVELEAEIAKRNAGVKDPEDHIPVSGNKPDLIQRLIEDDLE